MIQNFIEFLHEGAFIGIGLSNDSQELIKKYQIDNKINNPVSGKDLHVTVIYSKQDMPGLEPDGILDNPFIATIREFENYNGALVGLLDCPNLEMRHTYLLNKYNGTHDYDIYSPHVTLSYGFTGDFKKLPAFHGNIKLVKEYYEPANSK